MSDESSLIVISASARAAAWSARQSGFSALAVDQFGDVDLREVASQVCVVDDWPRGVQDAVAAYERALLRARTKAALQAKRRRGERVGQVPYGYQLGADGRTLVEHAGEQRAIGLVRELRASGLSQRAIVAHLNAHQLGAARGKTWHVRTIQRLLKAA